MLNRFRDLALLFAVLASSEVLAQDRRLNVLDPTSATNREITDLVIWSLVFSVIVLLGTGGALFYAVAKFRAKPGQTGDAPQFHGNNRLEVVLIAVPLLIVTILSILTAQSMARLNRAPEPAVVVDVKGWQFWWDFHYKNEGIRNSNEVVIPAGRPVLFNITSGDVIHSFWATSLGIKRDAIPMQSNRLVLTAEAPGVYYGQCAELCGASHANMLFRVIALPAEEYDAWVASVKAYQAPAPASANLQNGERVFAANCAACHAIQGTNYKGVAGPDLSYFGDRITLGAGIWPNTREYLIPWLKNPPKVKPGAKMPAFDGSKNATGQASVKLSDQEIEDLAAYLESLKLEDSRFDFKARKDLQLK
ncbi:cytochrome c oxidase subunit 2 [Deinobacterium chartae]|uniref:cytochrome-c oxidase n=1 Tax=Deinobacterium chartae TaxID=521158 RepID=A0A841I3K2_9DEIO|nr:cytochrome c oxidase subunit II [Deinobacterium chartae]MBB6099614.1 cytochrome c oxidase subunit 2 [Deinobacterium chartae]